MLYKSTRGQAETVPASAAILQGLAEDGGLYVPESIPKITKTLRELAAMSYTELAAEILAPFLDFTAEELQNCVQNAYTGRFGSPLIAPLVAVPPVTPEAAPIGGTHFLELFHGPTLAFKDMALSILPYLMLTSAKKRGMTQKILILTATSGDTGKAALEAFCDVAGIDIVVFYPQDGVSDLQKLQMITQEGENTFVFGVEGNFDDCQTAVKKIFSDENMRETLAAQNIVFSSANSINIGRLLPQICYYFYAYAQLLTGGAVTAGEEVNFVVPTGNFGNILAGFYAKQMGLPIAKLVCASNDNKVLYDFFNTGVYDIKDRPFYCTISPSMDILVSSNLERLLYHAAGPVSVRKMMRELFDGKKFELDAEFADFYGAVTTEEEARAAIKSRAGADYVMDPHTAVAYHAGQQYSQNTGDTRRQVVVSTASPYKFAEDVVKALGGHAQENAAQYVEELSRLSGLAVPDAIAELAVKPKRHNTVCPIDKMANMVQSVTSPAAAEGRPAGSRP